MTVVIGFNWPLEHDNSVSAIVDGELVFASEEERYTRHKHAFGEYPLNALAKLYEHLERNYGIKPQDISMYAVNYDMNKYPLEVRFAAWFGSFKNISAPASFSIKTLLKGFNNLDYAKLLIRNAVNNYNGSTPKDIKIIPVHHHLAHAASAYYFSGFGSAAVIVADGLGESDATTVWSVKNGNFEKLLSISGMAGSIGQFYEYTTYRFGYRLLEGAGKIMGLAPYGKEDATIRQRFEKCVHIFPNADEPYYLSFSDGQRFGNGYHAGTDQIKVYQRLSKELVGVDSVVWEPRKEIDQNAADIAFMLQDYTEKMMLASASWINSNVNEKNLALAGGVALNAKANMKIQNSGMFDDIFVFPGANDAGTQIGAAAYVYEHVLGGKMKRQRMDNVYLGPEYSYEEIRDLVANSKFKSEYVGAETDEMARLVARGNILAWYQGRAEFGPRALGNRSIVADPRDKDMWLKLNYIKGREFWRPLAPSLLESAMQKYLINPKPARFMIMMHEVPNELKERTPAICHVDYTTRPQTVTPEINQNWYNLIKSFGQLTEEQIVVNTSFNLAGEPIVETPKDAIRSFALGGFDALYLQGWLIKKQG